MFSNSTINRIFTFEDEVVPELVTTKPVFSGMHRKLLKSYLWTDSTYEDLTKNRLFLFFMNELLMAISRKIAYDLNPVRLILKVN